MKRGWRSIAGIALWVLLRNPWAQNIDDQLHGIVKISSESDGIRRTGTGFIVKLDADAAYILTASHVVEGDSSPRIEFYNRHGRTSSSRTLDLQGGQDKGLALLLVEGKDRLPPGLLALTFSTSVTARRGDQVVAIGFPSGADWQAIIVNVAGRAGTDITLSGGLSEGNSGGPILKDNRVVGIVTTVRQLGYATPAAIAKLYLEGNGLAIAETKDVPRVERSDTDAVGRLPAHTSPDWRTAATEARTVNGTAYYEVDFKQGLVAESVCSLVQKAPGQFATDPSVCLAFHPDAAVKIALSGDRAVVYCTGLEQGVCGAHKNACLVCPSCRLGVGPKESGGGLYARMYTTCGGSSR